MKKEEVKEKNTKSKNTIKKTASTNGDSNTKSSGNKKKTEKKVVLEKVVQENIEVSLEKEEKKEKKIKISDIILILGLLLVVGLGFFVLGDKSTKPTYELPLELVGEVGLHQLTYQEYKDKVDNNEAFVLIIERATCSHCVTFMPIAEKFATDYNVPMYYVDTDTFSYEDWSGFERSNSFLKKNSSSWGTPTTVVLVGSEALDYIEGATTVENLELLYKEYFKLNEE